MERTIPLKSGSHISYTILLLAAALCQTTRSAFRTLIFSIAAYIESFYERCETSTLSRKEILAILAGGAAVGQILHGLGLIL
ncbi:MAG: hypothetical protein HUJ54_03660 [Erysipelotrichaceae bacterium]|nr:hypothetical protein [Erysipelotrichaceae bacterium]